MSRGKMYTATGKIRNWGIFNLSRSVQLLFKLNISSTDVSFQKYANLKTSVNCEHYSDFWEITGRN